MSIPRQVVRLNGVQISESFVDEAVHRSGGRRCREDPGDQLQRVTSPALCIIGAAPPRRPIDRRGLTGDDRTTERQERSARAHRCSGVNGGGPSRPRSRHRLGRIRLCGWPGKPEIISVPASAELKAYVHDLARRVEAIKSRRVAPHIDNMLKVTSDGRKAALDIRLVQPNASRPPQSKVMALVEQIERLYHETQETRGVQLVFLDISTPKGSSDQLVSGHH